MPPDEDELRRILETHRDFLLRRPDIEDFGIALVHGRPGIQIRSRQIISEERQTEIKNALGPQTPLEFLVIPGDKFAY